MAPFVGDGEERGFRVAEDEGRGQGVEGEGGGEIPEEGTEGEGEGGEVGLVEEGFGEFAGEVGGRFGGGGGGGGFGDRESGGCFVDGVEVYHVVVGFVCVLMFIVVVVVDGGEFIIRGTRRVGECD